MTRLIMTLLTVAALALIFASYLQPAFVIDAANLIASCF